MSKIAVKCSNLIEKHKVIEFARKGKNIYTPPDDSDCVNLEDGYHQNESYYKKEGYTVIPYSQFEREYLGVTGSSSTLTELPEKWCIRIATKEINDAINRKGLHPSLELYWEDSPNYTTYYVTSGELYLSSKPNDHVELTEDQFKKWVLKEETPDTPRFKFKVGDEVNYKNSKITAVSNGLEGGWLSSSDVTHRMVESCHHSEVVGNCYKIGALYVSEVGLALKPQKSEEPPNPKTEQWTPKVDEWVVGWFCETKPENYHKNAWQIGEIKNGHYYVKGKVSHCTDKTNLRKALPHEIPSPTNESLLEEAKRKYPVGCKFECLVTRGEYVVPEGISFKNQDGIIYSYVNNGIFHKHYDGERWAEIIEEPKTHPDTFSWKVQDRTRESVGVSERVSGLGGSRDFSVGNWVYVETGGSGAYGANGRVGQVAKGVVTHGVSVNKEVGVKVNIEGDIWGLREGSYAIRTATPEEIAKATSGSILVGNGTGSTGVVNYPKGDGSITLTPSQYFAGVDPWVDIKWVEPVDLRFDGGKINFKKYSSITKPSPKITVKSHEEFKITVTKPKQIKL